jgi:predicted flap endonuclease-1-like 5' DNA nuclease
MFVGGLLAGWLIQFGLDLAFFRKKNLAGLETGAAGADPRELESLKAELGRTRTQLEALKPLETQVVETQRQLEEARAQSGLNELRQQLEQAQTAGATLMAENQAAAARINDLAAQLAQSQSQHQQSDKRVRELEARILEFTRPKTDSLDTIPGINDVVMAKLRANNITTYASLKALSEPKLREIVAPEPWESHDFQSWIDEASRRDN